MRRYIHNYFFVILLVTTLTISLFLRLYHLSSNPPGLHVDEISFGYNAYSLLHTGRDEFGMKLPIILRSYDDYRPALLSYLMIPFIKTLGLSIVSIRLPEVFLSFITLLALYKIIILLLDLSQQKKQSKQYIPAKYVAFSAIFLYAISPWNVFLSRLAIDTNLSLSFFMLSLWCFFDYIAKKKFYKILLSSIFFTITFYSYNGIKPFLPFILISLVTLFFKNLITRKKEILIAGILFLLLLIPLLLQYRTATNLNRFTYLNFFASKQDTVLAKSSQRLLYEKEDVLGKIFDNRRFGYIPLFVSNYFINLNPVWLYGDDYIHTAYKIPDFGLFYLFELPLLLLGLYVIFKNTIFTKRIQLFLLFWIVFSIIPAAVTINTPSAVRIYTLLPPVLIIEGVGLYAFCVYLSKQHALVKIALTLLSASTVLISFLWFFHAYFTLFPYERAYDYNYGNAQAIMYAKMHENQYKHILISNRGVLTLSYIYYLFFTKYDPQTYLSLGGTQVGGALANHVIGKYAFIDPYIYSTDKGVVTYHPQFFNPDTLYIIVASDFPQDPAIQQQVMQKVSIIKTIFYPTGEPAILILSPKQL